MQALRQAHVSKWVTERLTGHNEHSKIYVYILRFARFSCRFGSGRLYVRPTGNFSCFCASDSEAIRRNEGNQPTESVRFTPIMDK